jgi:hypothetical protein
MDKHLLLALFHIVLVTPLFFYIGFQRAATPEWVYNLIFGLGLVILAYHGSMAGIRLMTQTMGAWVNLIHAVLLAPLLLYIGYYGKKTQRPAYEMLLMVAFAALGYHLKSLIVATQTFIKDDS